MIKYFDIKKFVEDEYRYRIQMIGIPFLLGVVSLGMTILNLFTHTHLLGAVTLVFSILCFINMLITMCNKDSLTISYCFFSVIVTALSVYFLIYGGTEGFSPIWIFMLPLCGLIMMGKKKGTILCIVHFSFILFFYWTAIGRSFLQYDYTNSFLIRFPIVYISFYFVGYFFEYVRTITSEELMKMKNMYKELSIKDAVTGINNRNSFNRDLQLLLKNKQEKKALLAIGDIDFFKKINDTYGHVFGDVVLKNIATALNEKIGDRGTVCRWGGEEFAILTTEDIENEYTFLEDLRKTIKELDIVSPEGEIIHVTISLGAVRFNRSLGFDVRDLFISADKALYEAKGNGRDCVKLFDKFL